MHNTISLIKIVLSMKTRDNDIIYNSDTLSYFDKNLQLF